jgi:NADH-quinone oxidoreductase subunit N
MPLAMSGLLVITVGACAVLLLGLARPRLAYPAAQIFLAMAVVVELMTGNGLGRWWEGLFVQDAFAAFIKPVLLVVSMVVFLYGRPMASHWPQGEYYALGLMSVAGMLVMASAGHLLTLFLGLELMSLALYAMVALDRDNDMASEAAMKYFMLGGLSSGLLLYGFSLLYGMTGTLDLQQVAHILGGSVPMSTGLVVALTLTVAGVAFKLGVAPFHMWLPDVYEGSPAAVTLFVGAAPKVAALVLLARLIGQGAQESTVIWQPAMMVLSLVSMAVGSFGALWQQNIKRLLAYSAIAHMGFVLLGALAGGEAGYRAATFYMVSYAVMSTAAFGVVLLVCQMAQTERIADYAGLAERSPWLAAVMMLTMFSLAGVPPLLGFMAKLEVIRAAVGVGAVRLAVLAVLFSVVAAYYYLRVVKVMYMDAPSAALVRSPAVAAPGDIKLVLGLNGALLLLLGMMPAHILDWCQHALQGFLLFR